MIETIEKDGISIEMHLNEDRSVDAGKTMKVKYIHKGNVVERDMYPSKVSGKAATINEQFELAKSVIRFDQAYDYANKLQNPPQN